MKRLSLIPKFLLSCLFISLLLVSCSEDDSMDSDDSAVIDDDEEEEDPDVATVTIDGEDYVFTNTFISRQSNGIVVEHTTEGITPDDLNFPSGTGDALVVVVDSVYGTVQNPGFRDNFDMQSFTLSAAVSNSPHITDVTFYRNRNYDDLSSEGEINATSGTMEYTEEEPPSGGAPIDTYNYDMMTGSGAEIQGKVQAENLIMY